MELRALAVVVGLGAAGCGPADTVDSGTPEDQLLELRNAGSACLYGDGVPDGATTTLPASQSAFASDAPVDARVILDPCASGCAHDIDASCTVRVVNTEVVIDATASWLEPTRGGCPAVCVPIAATCSGAPLADGVWVLDYGGGHSLEFTVPGTGPAPCAEALTAM
ncbi:MAG: hypothetical protein R3F59_32300 [Myxococcota bacterium]